MTVIRPESPDDAPAIRAVHRAAFPTDDEAELVADLRDEATFDPDFSLVAVREGRVVGHVVCSPVGLPADPGAAALVLGPIGVVPGEQGAGIGSDLVEAVLDGAAGAGVDHVFLHGSPAFYSRFGFEPAGRYGFENPFDTPTAEFQVWLLSERQPGGGPLDYPAAFAAV